MKNWRTHTSELNSDGTTPEERKAEGTLARAREIAAGLTKPQVAHMIKLRGWGVTPGGDRTIHGFVAARVYNNLAALGLVQVYAEHAVGPRRARYTNLGRAVARVLASQEVGRGV